MEVKAGSRWRSAVCDTEVIVVRAPGSGVTLGCGGAEMVPLGTEAPPRAVLDPERSGGTQLGKRYADEEVGVELLCTKAGAGTLSVDGRELSLKQAKPLPSSD
ncbi:MAG: hypothetical protein ACR2KC_02405 [Acidimicrobiales bacterium]